MPGIINAHTAKMLLPMCHTAQFPILYPIASTHTNHGRSSDRKRHDFDSLIYSQFIVGDVTNVEAKAKKKTKKKLRWEKKVKDTTFMLHFQSVIL